MGNWGYEMNLNQWAIKWGIPYAAVEDLRRGFGMLGTESPIAKEGDSESAVLTRVRLDAGRKGILLWRNNVGATLDERGALIRFGLANESKAMNARVKSSDLIGVRPGGQFIAREAKAVGWKYTGTKREQAQLKFMELVAAMGGDAAFTTGENEL